MGDVLTSLTVGESVPLQFRKWYLPDRDKAQKWREEAREDFEFVAGRQLSDDEIRKLTNRKRPVVIFNRVGPIIDAITGYEIGNRREVRYIPREMGDVRPNEVLTSAGQWFRDTGFADYADSAMFASSVICGMGWTETRLNLTEGPNPKPVVDDLDIMEMAWDRDARQRNIRDARRVWRARRVPLAEAEAMFPGRTKAELHAAWSNVSSEADLMRDSEVATQDGDDYVTIVQCQWITKEDYYVAQDPITGQQAEFDAEEFATANKRLKAMMGMEMEGAKFRRTVRKQAFFGEVVLGYGPAPCNDQFSLQCVTGKFDRNKGTWYGVVRAMKDPARWANKWLAQTMHIMNSNAKGGIMAETGAFADIRKAEAEWAQPDSITETAEGAIAGGRIRDKPQAQFPVGFQQLTEFAISSIRDVSGVSMEMLGSREINQPASLEYQRRQAGINNLQWVFDGLKLYRQMQGEVILYYLQNDVPEGTLIRVVGKEQEQYVPLIKQADKEFDIIVDDAPNAPNQKEVIWGVIESLMPMVGKALPPQFIMKALKYSPLPETVVAELEQMVNAPNPQAQQQAALAARQAAAEAEETEASAALTRAQAQNEALEGRNAQMGAQNDRAEQEMKMTVSRAEFQQSMAKMAMEQQRDRERHTAEMQKLAMQMAQPQPPPQRQAA